MHTYMYSVSNAVMLYVSICADYKKKQIMELFLKILLFSLTNPSFGFAGEGCIAFWNILVNLVCVIVTLATLLIARRRRKFFRNHT